jgi:hypothetical protein
MQIFQDEIADGLKHLISASASVTYASIAEPCLADRRPKVKNLLKSIAAYDDSDLYYVQSILVSSSWNKNDDIFDPAEVWLARNTPEHKPTNLEHDENVIIGHITSNWPITEDGMLINDDTNISDLPEKYHILTGSVIYKGYSNQDLRDRALNLISEIENGTKFVSMECFFNGFDYGILDEANGAYKVLARNNSTAYLTKFLRAYGGSGKHDIYKIGRVLRNITFSGKGFVDKPANPDSIIFSKNEFSKIFNEKKDNLIEPGVSKNTLTSNAENHIMSSEVENTVVETTEAVKDCVEATASLTEKTNELESKLQAYETVISETKAALELALLEKEEAAKKMAEEMTKKEQEMMKKEEEMKKAKSELEQANETIAVYMKKEAEMMKKEKKMKRMASLVEAGFDTESAEATAEKFESLDDEAFATMTALFAAKMPPWLDKNKKDEEEKKKASEDIVDASVLENVETEQSIDLSVGGDVVSSEDNTRAELLEFVCARLGKKLNKGE